MSTLIELGMNMLKVLERNIKNFGSVQCSEFCSTLEHECQKLIAYCRSQEYSRLTVNGNARNENRFHGQLRSCAICQIRVYTG